jgi:hypothetical protein
MLYVSGSSIKWDYSQPEAVAGCTPRLASAICFAPRWVLHPVPSPFLRLADVVRGKEKLKTFEHDPTLLSPIGIADRLWALVGWAASQ